MAQLRYGMGVLAVAVALYSSCASPQESADELAKKLANPVVALISVPMQYDVDFDIGSENGTKHYLNIQPVIPHSLNEHTNLITRVITPMIDQDDIFGDSGSHVGLGGITPSFFFSPKEPVVGWILGAGPVFLLPTATDELLGARSERRADGSGVAADAGRLDLRRAGKPNLVIRGRRRPQRYQQHVPAAFPGQAIFGRPDDHPQF